MKTILIPTDFSKNANNTMRYAIKFAQEKKCKLIFFHAFYDPALDKVKNPKNAGIIKLETAHLTCKLLNEVKTEYSTLNIPFVIKNIETIIKFGKNIIDQIDQTSSEKNSDLVIIGTHGASGLKSVLFGSNTVKLISSSKVPVLIIPMGYNYEPIKKIIYSTDLYDTKKELPKLISINEVFRSELQLVYFDNEIEKTKAELNNIKLIETLGFPFFTIKINIDSSLMKNLTVFMKNKSNSVICLFHTPRKRILTLLMGSNTDDLALHLRSPLLSLTK